MTQRFSDLAAAIGSIRLVDTHEHLASESEWIEAGPDILQDLFWETYAAADLRTAGASEKAVEALLDPLAGGVGERFAAVQSAWSAIEHTGYGETVRLIASEIYGIEELTPVSIEDAKEASRSYRQPGEMLRMLQQVGGLDHVQIDNGPIRPRDKNGRPDFFLHDLSWYRLSNGDVDPVEILALTDIEVLDLEDLRTAIATIFERSAPEVVAVKSQHAYNRTLLWRERSDEDAARALEKALRCEVVSARDRWKAGDLSGGGLDEDTRLVLGDWCLARGVELATAYDLPFKIHTGVYSGNNRMPIDRVRSGHLAGLLTRYPDARFVLMHMAFPYGEELIAIAKHFSNVWVDLCWAWAINPVMAAGFVRSFLHAVPVNKLFAFGGDTTWPTNVVAAAIHARRWMTRTLAAEVAAGDLSESAAIAVAQRLMHGNQYECFDIGRFSDS